MRVTDRSRFIFIITSRGKLEDRFLLDIGYGIGVLRAKGVCDSDITIVSDASPLSIVAKCRPLSGIAVIPSSQLLDTVEKSACDNLFIISSCHGSLDGIDSASPVRPHDLTQAVKANQHAKNVLVFFGQCYAGIFNYMDIKGGGKDIVYIGATDVNTSLSHAVSGCPWVANISVLALFRWLQSPYDVDGDGILSVVDMYKYIAWFTNYVTDEIEKSQNSMLVDAKVRLQILSMQPKSANPLLVKLEQDAINIVNNYIIPHQTPWMLNASSAMKMHFD